MTDPTPAPILQTPVLVDYTNRDFYSLREQLIQRVKDRVNTGEGTTWYGNDAADFGLALIEAFAYMGDVTSYYIDRVANENTLFTASQRESVLNLAYSYGYIPSGYKQASCDVTFSSAGIGSASVPSGTRLRATITTGDVVEQVIFTTTTDADFSSSTKSIASITSTGSTVTYTSTAHGFAAGALVTVTGSTNYDVTNATITGVTDNTFTISSTLTGSTSTGTAVSAAKNISVTATHGENVASRTANVASSPDISGEKLGVSDGTASQVFQLKESQVVDGTIRIFVVNGADSTAIYGEWTEVIHLADYGPTDAVFRVVRGSNNSIFIEFGDGISGAIPNNYSTIKAQYVFGGGIVGNVPASTINTFVGEAPSGITVNNPDRATGGLNPEGIDAIRTNAPQAFNALNRAVSLTDYEGLTLQVSGAGKAKAVADVWSSVTLYLAPTSDDSSDFYPGKNSSNSAVLSSWTALQTSVEEALEPKLLIGTTLTVSPPTYTNIYLSVEYSKQPEVTDSQIQASIKDYIATYYGYSTNTFEQIIHPQEIEFILRYVPGIVNVWVTEFRREAAPDGALGTLVGLSNEIFVFNSDNIISTVRSTDATLSALTSSVGTLSPAFATGTLNYLVDIGSATSTTIAGTATSSALGASVTVDGDADSSSITNSTAGTTVNVPVIVTAADGRTLQTYTVAVYKSS
jgi:hypothetical protein